MYTAHQRYNREMEFRARLRLWNFRGTAFLGEAGGGRVRCQAPSHHNVRDEWPIFGPCFLQETLTLGPVRFQNSIAKQLHRHRIEARFNMRSY
jgi:hypothetical protein